MKLDPVFFVKDNKLFKISDNSQTDYNTFNKIEIPWTTVEMEDESYNEEFLATLRDQLKKMELTNQFAILVPIIDKPLETPEQTEFFINAFNHTARRIKDCENVVGFEIPADFNEKEAFMDTLAIKHAQYIYFSKAEISTQHSVIMY